MKTNWTNLDKVLSWVPYIGMPSELKNTFKYGKNYLSDTDHKVRFYVSSAWHGVWFCVLLFLFLSGCYVTPQVVTTRISRDADGNFKLESPKDVTIGSLITKRNTDGSFSVELLNYQATANAAALTTATTEAESRAELVRLLTKTTEAALH